MLWVTWRQHRALLISIVALFVVAVTAMLVEGPKLHHDDATLMACRPTASPACAQLANFLATTDWHVGNGVRVALLAASALIAMFAGPPVVARELENATFRYTWTQGIGRVRWTLAKLTIIGATVTIETLVVSLMFGWFFAPFLTTQHMTALTPVSTFWPMQFFESGWLLALSALLVAATIRLVNRHAI
jgi:hypothetical protein